MPILYGVTGLVRILMISGLVARKMSYSVNSSSGGTFLFSTALNRVMSCILRKGLLTLQARHRTGLQLTPPKISQICLQ